MKKIGAFNTKRQEWQEFSGSIAVNNEPNFVYLSVAINEDLLLVAGSGGSIYQKRNGLLRMIKSWRSR